MPAFTQGLSGLRADQKAIEVTSNNVANSNTIGFKASRPEFGDVYTGVLFSAGPQAGKGTRILDVSQQFTQGALTPTGSSLDLGIQGNGFFMVKDGSGRDQFTRNGAFKLDPDGFVVNATGDRLQGYEIDPVTGDANANLIDMRIIDEVLPPSPTSQASIRFNLDAREAPAPSSTFNPTDSRSFNSTTSMVVYDDLGREHTLKVYMTRLSIADANTLNGGPPLDPSVDGTLPSNTWTVRATLDGQEVTVGQSNGDGFDAPVQFGALRFNSDGRLLDQDLSRLRFDLSGASASGVPFSAENAIEVDFASSTQFGAGFIVQDLAQDGYESANFTGFDIDSIGRVNYQYANGQRVAGGMVSLFKFINPQGLQPVGANKWEATADAGDAMSFFTQETAFATVEQGFLEESNVDLTEQLVNLITFQRSYQANSQSIKTQDALLQTATNLRNG